MKKKIYLKPAMEIIKADLEEQLLVMSVYSKGLGDGDELEYTDERESSGDAWQDAW